MRLIAVAIGCIAGLSCGPQDEIRHACWPIATSQSTGTIQCWSGGQLVYQNSIYHNGGVLCAVDGHEIRITGGKSLCVIESSQGDVWNPPTPTKGELK